LQFVDGKGGDQLFWGSKKIFKNQLTVKIHFFFENSGSISKDHHKIFDSLPHC
jgi:hypothetical protein